MPDRRRSHSCQHRAFVRTAHSLLVVMIVPLLVTGCVRNGDAGDQGDDPTAGPQFVVVTLTPVPPGATVVIEPTATPDPATLRRHTIREGETLSTIAAAYGVSQADLQAINQIEDPNAIQVGQELLIPPS